MHPFETHCREALAKIRAEGRYRRFTPLARSASDFPVYREGLGAEAREITVWSTNDYLGMGVDPDVIAAGVEATRRFGAGAGGTRNIAGTTPLHDVLERELAALHGKEAGLLFVSGYISNQAGLGTILTALPDSHVFSDAKNHASMIAGIRSARGTTCHVYAHNDLADLERRLASAPAAAPKLVAFESVYSMDGDIADIAATCEVARRYGAMTYLDEVHAVGLYGSGGGGVSERDGVAHLVDIIEGTLAKGFGVHGGYVTGSADVIDYLRSSASGFIFTTAPPPSTVASAIASVRKVRASPELRTRLFERVASLRARLRRAGLPLIETPSHIVPIHVGQAQLCTEISRRLFAEHAIYATPINYPTVPVGQERLRLTPGPYHTDAMMDALVDALVAVMSGEGRAAA